MIENAIINFLFLLKKSLHSN